MADHPVEPLSPEDIPEAVPVQRRGISIVWLIPLVAALIGLWVAYQAYSEIGPTITISFMSAEGLEAGKTKVKYKDVEVGQVEEISLQKDLRNVTVTVQMNREMTPYLTEKTRFWVERARISAGTVSGLGTLLGGAYIGIDPVPGEQHVKHFTGLEKEPAVTTEQPGRHFRLRASRRGSLEIGAPIYFRQIKVGEVVSYDLAEDGNSVDFRVFIYAPHQHKVTGNTRFWNASGLDVSLSASGIKVNTESVVSLVIGGIAFEVPDYMDTGEEVEEDHVFTLYEDRDAAFEKVVTVRRRYLLNFKGSVRGLLPGASVEFRGIKLGEVKNISVSYDADSEDFVISVLVEIEPERLGGQIDISMQDAERISMLEGLVDHGLRAQLKTGNLLTGQLYIDLDFHPEVKTANLDLSGKYPAIPTIPTSLEELSRNVNAILGKLERFPLDQLGDDLTGTLSRLDETIGQAKTTLKSVDRMFAADAPLSYELQQSLRELSDTARSLRLLADYLNEHPEALLRGKGQP